MKAKEYFENNEPHDPAVIIAGQRVSKVRCIELMEEYANSQLGECYVECDKDEATATVMKSDGYNNIIGVYVKRLTPPTTKGEEPKCRDCKYYLNDIISYHDKMWCWDCKQGDRFTPKDQPQQQEDERLDKIVDIVKSAWTPDDRLTGGMSEGKRLLALEKLFNKHKVDKSILTQYGLGLGEFLRALKELRPLPTELCHWEYSSDDDDRYYDTECGNAYCLTDGTLEENKHKHCPYCGKSIKLLKPEN